MAKTKRPTCTCPAYEWPHRPGGGLCRFPDPPLGRCATPAGTNRPTGLRRRGARRWLMRYYKLHPIRDRALIDQLLPTLYANPPARLQDVLDGTALAGGELKQLGPTDGNRRAEQEE